MSSFEITAGMASTLGAIPLAAHSCVANFQFFFMPLAGSFGMMATTIRVGNLLGEGRPRQARLAGRVSVTLCCGMMLVSCVVLFFFRNSFGKVYSSDPEVIAAASEVVPQLAPYLVAFGMTMSFRGTIGGCGKQVVSAKLGLFTWYVVGLPLGALFCFVWGFGLQGLWSGLVLGSWFQICCFTYWLGRRLDWAGESKRARSRALKQKPKE